MLLSTATKFAPQIPNKGGVGYGQSRTYLSVNLWTLFLKTFTMKASFAGQLFIAAGGFMSILLLGGLIWRLLFGLIRYVQWMNMAIIYVAKETGTPLPRSLIDQYHVLPFNGKPLTHLVRDTEEQQEESDQRMDPPPQDAQSAITVKVHTERRSKEKTR
jgi:hypothetical protein